MAVSSQLFRQVLGRFSTGVTIVTTKNETGIHGLTVNAFTSVSLEPPLVLICILKMGVSHSFISGSDYFVVNILSEEQRELALQFADPMLDSESRFENVALEKTGQGIPILKDTLGHLQCRIVNQFEGGDHTIFLGEVEQAGFAEDKRPLIFYEGQFHHL